MFYIDKKKMRIKILTDHQNDSDWINSHKCELTSNYMKLKPKLMINREIIFSLKMEDDEKKNLLHRN